MRRKITQVLAFVVAAAIALPALADTTLIYDAAGNDYRVKIRPGEVRIDGGGERWQLYREKTHTVYSVDPDARTYTPMDASTARVIQAQIRKLRTQMNQRLQQLPPDQRAQARAAMTAQVPGLDKSQHTVDAERTGEKSQVSGHPCEVVQMLRDGKPRETLCVAKPASLGISDSEFATVESMFNLMDKMLSGTGFAHVGLPYLNLSGMPIRYQDRSSGVTRRLKRVSHDTLSGLVFEIPPGYRKQTPTVPGKS